MTYLQPTLLHAFPALGRVLPSTARRVLCLVALSLLAWHPRLGAQTTPTVETIYSFTSEVAPGGELIQDAAGNLYGTTLFGGSAERGTVFQFTPTRQLNILLFGTTTVGGGEAGVGPGTVFEIASGLAFKTLNDFPRLVSLRR